MKAARQAWRRLEPLHAMIYFVPEGRERYEALGLKGMSGYFVSRSAPLGRPTAEMVIATFYNFHPDRVRKGMAGAWEKVTPSAVLEARAAAAGDALRRAKVHELPELDEVTRLARRAAEAATEDVQGRPLFAAHATLDWPDDTVTQLWHAQTLLREYRGDGHIAVLVSEGVGPLDALVLHAASGDSSPAFLKGSRAWPEEEWLATEERMRARGLLDGESLSAEGKAFRQHIEDRTDALALPAYAALGEADCERLAALAAPYGRAVIDAGLMKI